MQARRYLWLTFLLLGAVLAACAGGSGSSGFDVAAENAAIQQALSAQQCVPHPRLTICPADEMGNPPVPSPTARVVTPTPPPFMTPPLNSATPTARTTTTPTQRLPSPTPTATLTPAPQAQRVDTTLIVGSAQACTPAPAGAQCGFAFGFAPQGFPPDAVFRVAERRDSSGAWTIGPVLASNGSPASPLFDTPVAVAVPTDGTDNTAMVQLAVLVFLDPTVVVPAEVDQLADSGATFAYVTTEIAVHPQTPPLGTSP